LIPTTIAVCYQRLELQEWTGFACQCNYQIRKAVETAGDIDVLLWIKLEPHHHRKARFIQQRNLEDDFIKSVVLSSLADDTPEGKSIVELAGIEVANKLSIRLS
jgi:high-affinity K+ transport system ATPase subunit B